MSTNSNETGEDMSDECISNACTADEKRPDGTSGNRGRKLSPEEIRALARRPLPRIEIHGHSGGHGGVEMPPTNPNEMVLTRLRTKRKPSLSWYDQKNNGDE